MPVGNGETTVLASTVLAFPLAPVNGSNFTLHGAEAFILQNSLSFFVSMTTAMASDTSLFKLAMVSLVTDPPLFGTELQSFEQRLDMERATVTVSASTSGGGLSFSTRVFVDAYSNTVTAALNTSAPVQLSVRVQSVHPNTSFSYAGGFIDWASHSVLERSGPDIFEELGGAGAGRVVISHRNENTDFPAAFNYTLEQQGLRELIPLLQSSDRWRHRQFGMALSGTAAAAALVDGGGVGGSSRTAGDAPLSPPLPLRRPNESALVSPRPSVQFEVIISTYAKVTGSREQRLAQLTQQHDAAVGVAPTGKGDAGAASRQREAAHAEWWAQFWNRSHIIALAPGGADPNASAAAQAVTQTYAATRFVEAIRTCTWVPIKFNGEIFTATLPPEGKSSGPSYCQWGANSWWQNTRLPYWSMAPAGDFDHFESIFEFYLQTLPFNTRRTQSYFNHTGIFYTETKTLFDAYAVSGYGFAKGRGVKRTSRPSNLPVYRERSASMNYDFGGDAGGPEVSMMILDHFECTRNASALRRYFPIVARMLEFFRQHYKNRTASGTMVTWPTQALEKYKCANTQTAVNGVAWHPPNATNCISNDAPTVVALHVLLERVLRLPAGIATASELADWKAFQGILPPVPVQQPSADGAAVESTLPYGGYPTNYNETVHHNGYETPEMFAVHPYRYFYVGREALGVRRPRTPATNCLLHAPGTPSVCRVAQKNFGWTQLPMNAALLGDAPLAQKAVADRATGGSAEGYRFIGFAPHEQDYKPAAEQFANLNSGLQWMLVQPADDGNGSSIGFAAWPCNWDVDLNFAAPYGTTM